MDKNPLYFAVLALISILLVATIVNSISKDVAPHSQNKNQPIESVKGE